MPKRIFLSYAREDKKEVAPLINKLLLEYASEGTVPEIDDPSNWSANTEVDIRSLLKTRIENSDEVVVLTSPQGLESPWIQYEIGMADALGIPVTLFDHTAGGDPSPRHAEAEQLLLMTDHTPSRIVRNDDTSASKYGTFSFHALPKGLGTSIGNSLRRILLTKFEGAAITAVKIEGIHHEFSSIPGVVEDATDIILNLKQIPLRLHGSEPKFMYLRGREPGSYLSADIEHDTEVEILDNNIYIASVREGGSLEIDLRVNNGRGYVSADRNFTDNLGIGYIPIDSIHSPVQKVMYYVEPDRSDQATDFDKLTIEIWTNTVISPRDALASAATLLRKDLKMLTSFDEVDPSKPGTAGFPSAVIHHLNKSVAELDLSVHAYNCLKDASIRTVGELVTKTETELLNAAIFDRDSLYEIKAVLGKMGLSFGMWLDKHGHALLDGRINRILARIDSFSSLPVAIKEKSRADFFAELEVDLRAACAEILQLSAAEERNDMLEKIALALIEAGSFSGGFNVLMDYLRRVSVDG